MIARSSTSIARGFSALELLFVLGITGVVAAIAVPLSGNALGYYRLSGDARSVSNALSVTKMRAAATFGRARIYVDLAAKSYRVETQKDASSPWVPDSGYNYLNSQNSFGYGAVTSAPANTQTTIGQASPCLDASAHPIGNTACIIFNSRGIPIDSSGSPTGIYALYLTDGTAVYGATLSATGMTRLWRTQPTATPSWILQ
jgi:prepilin-type N-terminal cleavage/methylation domain-containing protein